ncbi:PAS domain S-box protein [Maribacter polysiphoniae]|uniref:histidine kinase n=1 Tax=Maribacter polysiphoniae TaxID=429344 RepID=A0A316DJQ8_9FLAO|nr:PAS domain S-box protein [Maribacter polysiphoniae]MBD1263150.1 PAS domain S-box protein [Maribacter polysiphoniae]PWK18351.1 PAS domain S-box-containing protein [Maribacter polysiphoniae]
MKELQSDIQYSNNNLSVGHQTHLELIAALNESNRKLNTLINNLPGYAYRAKNDKNYSSEYKSAGCLVLTGYTPEEFVNGTVQFGQLILEEDRKMVWNNIQKALAKKEPFSIQFRIKHKSGKICHFWEQGQGVYDAKNGCFAIEGFVQDVTEKIAYIENLSISEEKNKDLIKTLPDLVIVYDKLGNHLEVHAHDSFELVAPFSEHIGKNIDVILPSKVCGIIRRGFKLCDKTKETQLVEYSLIVKDELRHYESRINQTDQGDFLAIIRDITERKTYFENLCLSEEKNRAIFGAHPDLISVYDINGNLLQANMEQHTKLFDATEELIGKNVSDFLQDKTSVPFINALKEADKHHQIIVEKFELRIRGRQLFFEVRFVPFDKNKVMCIGRDITEKKDMEDTLFLQQRALAASSSGIVIADARQHDIPIIYTNDAFLTITGYHAQDIVGKNFHFLQGDDIEQYENKIMEAAIAEGKCCQVVLRNYRKDRRMFWNEISLTPVFDEKKTLTHFIGIQNDVTVRKQKDIIKSGVNTVMDMIIQNEPLKDIGDKIVDTIEKTIPNSMASLLLLDRYKNTLHKLSGPNLPEKFATASEGLSIGPNVGSCGTAAFTKKEVITANIASDPNWVDLGKVASGDGLQSCWSFPILSSKDEVLGTFAVYNKVSRLPLVNEKQIMADMVQVASMAIEQHEISLALKDSTDKLADYTKNLEDKVDERTQELQKMVQKLVASNLSLEDQIQVTEEAEKRAMTNQQLFYKIAKDFPMGFVEVVDANYEVVFIEGEEWDELRLKDVEKSKSAVDAIDLAPEHIKEKLKSNIERTFDGEHCSFEVEFQDRSYMVNTAPLFDVDNTILKVLLVYNNISLQKEAEHEIIKALKREQELSELKSRFVSTASHEFRTPLSTILSAANLIERQNDLGKEEKRIGYVDRIKSSVKNLVIILNEFLSLSKLEEGKVEVQPSTFDSVDFSKTIIEEIQGNAKKGQVIKFVSGSSKLMVSLDSNLLRHIVHNLLSNAIKYSEENTEIIYKMGANHDLVEFSVEDQGIGIPEEDQDHLFKRFHRAKNAVNIQGTGLGLNIVKQYAELMGGTISFKTELDKGTIFFVKLPINQNEDEKNTTH